jgi:hypothetical protein
MPFAMDETEKHPYHPSLIDMRFLASLGSRALCLTFLVLAACSGDDNAAPPASGGSAGSGGSGGSGGSTTEASTGNDSSSSSDVSLASDAGDAAKSEATDTPNCPSLPEGGTAATMDGGEGGADDGGPFTFPQTLVETGLYCDFAAGTISPQNKLFRPKYELWSDGAVKTRWFYLPPGQKVDTTNMDMWSMPVGARFWKEFKYNGKRIETRLIVRTGPGAADFNYAAYKWSPDEKSATLWNAATGEKDYAPIGPGAEGLMHDIPSESECGRCHGPLPSHILGFSAFQLSHNLGGENLTSLTAANLLSTAPPAAGYTVPGNNVEEPALGFLHANCGNCHNETSTGVTVALARPYMVRLLVANTTVASTNTYMTAVNVKHSFGGALPEAGIGTYRIQGGNPDASELHYRMSTRSGVGQQMPPIDTKIVTPEGLTTIENWIKALPPPSDAGDGG